MKYYADCEFDGLNGPLLSLALIREDNKAIYIILKHNTQDVQDPWVTENVMPIMLNVPKTIADMVHFAIDDYDVCDFLEDYFFGDKNILIYTDWPDDVAYICKALITGPGKMINIPSIRFEVVRVDAYPTQLRDAVQHNAYWDAQALRTLLRVLPL